MLSGFGIVYYTAIFQPNQQHMHVIATAQAISATAYANSPTGIYNQITDTHPFIKDPLDGTQQDVWITRNWKDGGCGFSGGAYHNTVTVQNTDFYCLSFEDYSNFAFQIQMTLIKGSMGGIAFRAIGPGLNLYFFAIHGRSYSLEIMQNNKITKQLAIGYSPAIKAGLNPTNVLTVIAKGTQIYLFANKQFLTMVTDNTFSAGQIGVVAGTDYYNSSADVAFNNEKVWEFA